MILDRNYSEMCCDATAISWRSTGWGGVIPRFIFEYRFGRKERFAPA